VGCKEPLLGQVGDKRGRDPEGPTVNLRFPVAPELGIPLISFTLGPKSRMEKAEFLPPFFFFFLEGVGGEGGLGF
jgi:hypothetical protein